MDGSEDKPLRLPDPAAWRRWLEANHAKSGRVWLVIAKKGKPGVHYAEAVEEALAFGWIDGTGRRLDEDCFLQSFSPRKRGSVWARSNKERIERLSAEGRMAPAGMAAVERARADGSWCLLDDVDALVVPEDLAEALAADAAAQANWDAFPASARKMSLYWIASAKRPETRAKRIEATVRDSAANVRRIAP